jgi:hypothetical protein
MIPLRSFCASTVLTLLTLPVFLSPSTSDGEVYPTLIDGPYDSAFRTSKSGAS